VRVAGAFKTYSRHNSPLYLGILPFGSKIFLLEGFLKSFVRKVLFLGLVIVSITMVTSCKQEMETAVEEIQLTEQEAQIIEQYSEIGKGHNDGLTELYTFINGQRAAEITTEQRLDLINEYYGLTGEEKYITMKYSIGRSASSPSLVKEISEQEVYSDGIITNEVQQYLLKIEELLLNATGSYDDIMNNIILIEKDAMSSLSDIDLSLVMGYAETAKSSISYWKSELPTENVGRNVVDNLKLAAIIASSDAAGTLTGMAAANVFLQATRYIIPNFPEMVGIACGIISSANAAETGRFCCIIDVQGIIERILKKYGL
jgi:hypothetical protein